MKRSRREEGRRGGQGYEKKDEGGKQGKEQVGWREGSERTTRSREGRGEEREGDGEMRRRREGSG